jgi:hypothetical protein
MEALQLDSRCLMADTFLALLEQAWAARLEPTLAELKAGPSWSAW